jgi:hypothetical protein
MKQGDTLSGGEFFAAIRLVIHAEHGKEVDRALAFVQGVSPTFCSNLGLTSCAAHPTPSRPQSRNETPIKNHLYLPPPPSRRQTVDSSIYSATSSTRFSSTSEPPPRSASPPKRHPPPPTHHPQLHPSQHAEPPKPILQQANHNPFLQRLPDTSSRLPPLPPRKPPPPPVPSSSNVYLAPPRHGARSVSPSSSGAATPTVAFPKPASHVTSALIKQSLQASKAAQSMKKAEEQLEKERVMQVLKSSSVVSGSHSFAGANGILGSSVVIGTSVHNRAHSPIKDDPSASVHSAPPLPGRRHHYQQQPSPPMSTSSLEQVALATTGVHPDSPPRMNLDLPPPQHPDRKPPSTMSSNIESFEAVYGPNTSTTTLITTTEDPPTARVFRSKSLHQPSPPRPPLPPPLRRKRPESAQMLSSGEVLFTSSVRDRSVSRHTSFSSPTPTVAHRRSSLSVSGASASSSPYPSTSHDPLPHMSNIQRTIANLQPKLDALRFDGSKARYKAEAGLSRRGFVRDSSRGREDQEGLMPSSGEDTSVDSAVEDEDELYKEKDNLKWPAGEGWKPL